MSISTDSITGKHGSTVSIANAQIALNATHGSFVFGNLEDTSGGVLSATCGYYLTVTPPHAMLEMKGWTLRQGSGTIASTADAAIPAIAFPPIDQYIPALVTYNSVAAWSTMKIDTAGKLQIYATATLPSAANDTDMDVATVSGQWCIQQY
jgi:hypothetical protein